MTGQNQTTLYKDTEMVFKRAADRSRTIILLQVLALFFLDIYSEDRILVKAGFFDWWLRTICFFVVSNFIETDFISIIKSVNAAKILKLYDIQPAIRFAVALKAVHLFGWYIMTQNEGDTMVDTISDFTAFAILLEIDNLT